MPNKIVTMMETEKLSQYNKNAKIHTETQINAISRSIEQFGFNVPLLVNQNTKTIVAGHGRYLAAQNLGLKEVPVLFAPDMTPEEEKAYRILDNSIGMSTGFDSKILQEEIGQLYEFDMGDFGFGFPSLSEVTDEDAPVQRETVGGKGEPKPPKNSLPKCKCPSCGHRFNKVVKTEEPKTQTVEVIDLDKALEEFLNT